MKPPTTPTTPKNFKWIRNGKSGPKVASLREGSMDRHDGEPACDNKKHAPNTVQTSAHCIPTVPPLNL
eukprot:3139894-Amphidinium_carterae.1